MFVRRFNLLSARCIAFAGLCALALGAVGCQQMQRIFHTPGSTPADRRTAPFTARLAGYAPAEDNAAASEETAGIGAVPADAGSNALPAAYSVPNLALLPFIVLPAQIGQFGTRIDVNVARSGALVSSNAGVIGRAGLTGTSATFGAVAVSRPGLQEGPATGLGFASPGRNLFVRQVNPLSGPNGRCRDLARAGFFGGDHAACERAGRR
ncbi:MAG TPA: hypothetical protein P5572_18735 [Phycisphaerae bacterium]|nr:hypothetical protein [Phycisphaerae bacterium]